MWTTNPELASLLANTEDGYKYMQSSNVKLDWKCNGCKEIIKNRMIEVVKIYGSSCAKCSDGKSYAEKILYNLLKQLDIDFELEKSFIWSDKKRYDFYLSISNTIIEVHGEQHYKNSHKRGGYRRTLEEEQTNDKYKQKLANDNDISNYIIINAMNSNIQYIRESIKNSELAHMFNLDNIDWVKIGVDSSKSIKLLVLDEWNRGEKSTLKIANKFKLSKDAVRKYLVELTKIGLCDYNGSRKRVLQVSSNIEIIKTWDSVRDILQENSDFIQSSLRKSCRTGKEYKGYYWEYC